MATHDEKTKDRNIAAVEALRRLDEIGAIKLDVLVAKSAEIRNIVGGLSELDPEDKICYPFVIRIGPRHDLDLVTVSNELRQLGFDVKRMGK